MNYYGIVKLIIGSEEKHSIFYTSREDRASIIARWKKSYGDSFFLYDVQIAPKETFVIKKIKTPNEKRLKFMQEESRQRYIRPPAVYDNQKSLYP